MRVESAAARGKLMQNDTEESPFLMGWKEIAQYLNMGLRTAKRYEQEHRLPVRRPLGNLRGPVHASKTELDAWMSSFAIRLCKSKALFRSPLKRDELRTRISLGRRLRFETSGLQSQLLSSIVALQRTIAVSQNRTARVVEPNDGSAC